MNLIDAINSCRPFKRPCHSEYLVEVDSGEMHRGSIEALFLRTDLGTRVSLMAEDLLANDWQIQEPRVTITCTQFDKAAAATLATFAGEHIYWPEVLNRLARSLGL